MGNRGLILAVLVIALLGDIVSGGIGIASPATGLSGCNNPRSLEQCGTGTCNILSGVTSCNAAISFNPHFATVPGFVGTTITSGLVGVATQGPIIPFVAVGTNVVANDPAWVNMPSGNGPFEIFGNNVEDWRQVDFTNGNAMTFTVTLASNTFSSNATAFLEPQFSMNGGGTWNNFQGGGCKTFIDGSQGNPVSTICTFGSLPVAGGCLPSGESICYIRVVGGNGGGVGDTPIFASITGEIDTALNVIPGVKCTSVTVSGASCIISLNYLNNGGTLTETINWIVTV